MPGFAHVGILAPSSVEVIGVLRRAKTSWVSDFTCYFSWMPDFGLRALGELVTVFLHQAYFAFTKRLAAIAIID